MHDAGAGELARRVGVSLVDYADGEEASALGQMLGGLIEANVEASAERRRDFEALHARVGILVTDIEEGVTLDFQGDRLVVGSSLEPGCDVTIRADSATVMQLSSLKVGFAGLPNYLDSAGRGVLAGVLSGRLKVEGIFGNLTVLIQVTRLFSVA
jgi:hypothetical protein